MEIKFKSFFREELSIDQIQEAIDRGEITSKELVMYYLDRIANLDQSGPRINSMLEINAVPAGYMDNGRPFGITFAGTAFSEGNLIKFAFAFEQATKHRIAPKL